MKPALNWLAPIAPVLLSVAPDHGLAQTGEVRSAMNASEVAPLLGVSRIPAPVGGLVQPATEPGVTEYRLEGKSETVFGGGVEIAQLFPAVAWRTENLLQYTEACFAVGNSVDVLGVEAETLIRGIRGWAIYASDPSGLSPGPPLISWDTLRPTLIAITPTALEREFRHCLRYHFAQPPLLATSGDALWLAIDVEDSPLWHITGYQSGGRTAHRASEGQTWAANNGVLDVRLGIVHLDNPAPPPQPPQGGDDYSACVPTTTSLVFDGGFRVSMCYETPAGDVGEGRGGIWASGQAGLLWFFDRGNAEVLVKLLNGCGHNAHHWIFVAPVTNLAFNLHVTDGSGRRWTYRNEQGRVASSLADMSAFSCTGPK